MSNFTKQKSKENRPFIGQVLWYFTSAMIFENSLFPFMKLKSRLLTLFGAEVAESVLIKPNVKIKYPWKLKIGTNSSIGEHVWIDNTENIIIGNATCISQGVYLCTGNHDYTNYQLHYFGREISIGNNCWICAKAMVFGGSQLLDGVVVGPGMIVNGLLKARTVYRLSSCVIEKKRKVSESSTALQSVNLNEEF